MKVSVCELPDDRAAFDRTWSDLAAHVRDAGSELVLLPEMPFCKWFAGSRTFDRAVWAAAVQAHDAWERRLHELAPAFVLSSRPVDFGNQRYDEAFVWDAEHGVRSVHAKANLPDEDGAREGSWYDSATPDFIPLELEGVRIAFLMGAELLAQDEAQRYGEEGVDVLAMPRGGGETGLDDWLARGRALAMRAGAYGLSSNRSGAFGGKGWIIAPDGELLGATSETQPFLSLDLELTQAPHAGQPAGASIDPWETGVPPY